MAKIIWLCKELILMMDSYLLHRHGTIISGVSIEGKDDDDIMHANYFNQGGVLHSTVAFGYLSQCRTLEFRCCAWSQHGHGVCSPLVQDALLPLVVVHMCAIGLLLKWCELP